MKKNFQKIIGLGLLLISTAAFSQIKEERLILDKKREPEVKKIEKKKTSVETIKNYPPEEKSQNPVQYDIQNVPAVSDFETSTIQGEDVSPKMGSEYHKNYVRFGMGNYSQILGDANVSYLLENKTEVGIDAHVLSNHGLKEDYSWNSRQSNINLGAFLNSYGEKGKFNVTGAFDHDNYNYYGIYALEPSADIDLKQETNVINLNGYYDHYSNEILNDVRVKTSFLSDYYDAKESLGAMEINLSKHSVDFPLEDVKFNADLGLGIKTLNTEFSLLNQNSSNYFVGNIVPELTFSKGNSHLRIGSGFSFLNSKYTNLMMTETLKTNKTYWFPRAEILFSGMDEFNFFMGVDGGLKMNSYAEILQENPYLVSDQEIRPTETKYRIYFGIKGDVNEMFKYNITAGYSKVNDIMFFRANDLFDYNLTLNRSAYNYANTFSATYADGSVNRVDINVNYFPLQNLSLDGEVNYAYYKLEQYEEIYNRPLFRVGLGAKYAALENKLLLGFKGYFSTQRTTNSFYFEDAMTTPPMYNSTEDAEDQLDGFADLNLSAEYKFHKNFSIFVLGNNLLNNKYELYKGYKVLGAQFLGGVKITF